LPYKENVGFVAEIQVHQKSVPNLEKMFGLQNHYKYFPSCVLGPDQPVKDTIRDSLDTMIQLAGKNDRALMGKILDSEDADQHKIIQ
jgi:hypothetical protein